MNGLGVLKLFPHRTWRSGHEAGGSESERAEESASTDRSLAIEIEDAAPPRAQPLLRPPRPFDTPPRNPAQPDCQRDGESEERVSELSSEGGRESVALGHFTFRQHNLVGCRVQDVTFPSSMQNWNKIHSCLSEKVELLAKSHFERGMLRVWLCVCARQTKRNAYKPRDEYERRGRKEERKEGGRGARSVVGPVVVV